MAIRHGRTEEEEEAQCLYSQFPNVSKHLSVAKMDVSGLSMSRHPTPHVPGTPSNVILQSVYCMTKHHNLTCRCWQQILTAHLGSVYITPIVLFSLSSNESSFFLSDFQRVFSLLFDRDKVVLIMKIVYYLSSFFFGKARKDSPLPLFFHLLLFYCCSSLFSLLLFERAVGPPT